MAKVIFGNHSAVRVSKDERENIRKFYCDILGGRMIRTLPDKDDMCLGSDFYIAFLYAAGNGHGPEKGVNYGAQNCLGNEDFLKAIFLELKTDDIDNLRQQIISFGAPILEVPDPHLYFQAPGGQVFRLVSIDEDLSKYESD